MIHANGVHWKMSKQTDRNDAREDRKGECSKDRTGVPLLMSIRRKRVRRFEPQLAEK